MRVCKGSIALGTGCDSCSKCLDEREAGIRPPPRRTTVEVNEGQSIPAPTKTIRDEFAMAALTGLVTKDCDAAGFRWDTAGRVKAAYRYADAMMAERGK